MFFFEDCIKTLQQCMSWMRDKDTGKPIKKNDDQCENLYRLMLLDTQYVDPEIEDESESSYREGVNPVTGY